MDEESTPSSRVSSFYAGRSIFLTGGTGFLGKALIWKLLTSSPGIGRIYVLVRPKRDLKPKERLVRLLAEPIFQNVDAALLGKVAAVAGDVTQTRLGMSDEDRAEITREVTVIFHSAASVRFDEDLASAAATNVQGTMGAVQLAWDIGLGRLESFVHVSTAFSQCHEDHDNIEEAFYRTQHYPETVLHELGSSAGSQVATRMIGKHPNTYTFTKALGEQVVHDHAAGLPASVVRPSMVVGAVTEPSPGWVDNLNGPSAVVAGTALGVLRSIVCSGKKKGDLVPVDTTINLICVVGWKNATRLAQKVPAVYNGTTGGTCPFTWEQFRRSGMRHGLCYPFESMVWLPGVKFMSSSAADRLLSFFCSFLPALCGDGILRLTGRKPFLAKKARMVMKTKAVMEYFTTREWNWSTKNVEKLQREMNETDERLYRFTLDASFDWDAFMKSYILGVRRFVFHEDPDSVQRCRRKLIVFVCLDWLLRGFLLLLPCVLFYFVISYIVAAFVADEEA